jgi:cytochrome c oxidase cbb3-type subunit I
MKPADDVSPGIASAIRHALTWLVVGNAIGVLLAVLLLVPALNPWLGEWSYGRWMMVHMNLAIFGWASLPMVGFLFHVYGAHEGPTALWCRPAVWLWSAGLLVGAYSWLCGESSGKLFLDWTGFARIFFPLALGVLWLLLSIAFLRRPRLECNTGIAAIAAKTLGLLVLLAVPFALYVASSSGSYPFINPDTGGPTGQSQLESSLGVVFLLLLVPYGIAPRAAQRRGPVLLAWTIFAAEIALCASLGRADISHHVVSQWLSLGSMLLWIPVIPAYYRAFQWRATTRPWRIAMLLWWALLVLSGWVLFLPGILDRIKFTDVLVGHSLVAVAGFLSALLLFVMTQLLGDTHAWVLTRTWSFVVWNFGLLAYVVVITIAGVLESGDPAFTIVPGIARDALYILRLLTGVAMLAASLEWLFASRSLSQHTHALAPQTAQVEAA